MMQAHVRNGLAFVGACVALGLVVAVATLPRSSSSSAAEGELVETGSGVSEEASAWGQVTPVSDNEPDSDAVEDITDPATVDADYEEAIADLGSEGELPLQLLVTGTDRQRLASGAELLAVNGRIINSTAEPQVVPPLVAQLRGSDGQLVHSWTIPPPVPALPPGRSASFTGAETEVPAGGDELTITFAELTE